MRRLPVVVSCIAAALCVLDAQTPQQPTFRTGVDVVAVDVRVVDGKGRPVADLRPDDFVVTVDGQARALVTADFVSYSLTTNGPRPASSPGPVVPSPPTGSSEVRPTPGRSVVIVVDEENIRSGYGKWAADAAARFVDRMQRDDRVGLLIPRSNIRIVPTTQHAVVKAALSHVVGHMAEVGGQMGPAEACDAVYGPQDQVRAPRSSPPDFDAKRIVDDMRQRTSDALRSIAALLDSLGTEPGPKTIVLISEEMPVCDHVAERAEHSGEFKRVGESAARAQAMLYVLQLDRPVTDVEGRQSSSPRDRDMRSSGLETVVSITGGDRMMVSGIPDAPLDRIALEISGQYLLGFRSEPADRDGKAHPITVKVRRKGVRVYARQMFAYSNGPVGSADATSLQSTTAMSRATQLVQGVDQDLRVLEKGELTGDERKQRDRARSQLQSARRLLENAKGQNEMEAASLAMAASKEVAPLVRRQLQLDRLMAAAEQYRSGKVADAAQALSESLASDLDAPVGYIESNRDRLGLEGTALADLNDRTLAALCLLETEVAFQGRFDASVRLAWMRRLLSVANPARLPRRFVERWHIAVAGHLQGQFELMEAMLHVEDAVRRFQSDADILVVAGMFYETVASPSVDLPPRAAPGRTLAVQMTSLLAAPPARDARYERLEAAKQTGLGRAEEFYRRAVASDAGHAEAHLRLGRVLFLTSRSDAALSELQVAAGNRDLRVHYLASMFQGAVQEAAQRLDAAVPCYEEALRTCPNCLSAGLALSHAQRRSGDPDLAARTLDAASGRDATAAFDDYWWDYPLGALRQRDGLMRDLRGGLR